MASDTPPEPNVEHQPSDSPARDRFASAVKEKMENQRSTPPERSLWRGGYSPKAMYGTWVISAVLTIAAITAVALLSNGQPYVWPITAACIMLWWCFAIGTYMYRQLGMHYELTTQRLIHQVGILVRHTDRIEVIDIDDVSYTQGLVQRMLGVGTIRVSGSDRTHPELLIRGIDKVPEVASLIDDIRREERRRRSLHIES